MAKWISIKGFEGLYEVSDDGEVRSLGRTLIMKDGVPRVIKPRIMKQRTNNRGYHIVDLYDSDSNKHTVLVHRLVAIAFLKPVEGKDQANHKDGNKSKNHVGNLEWTDQPENMQHAYDTGLREKSMNWEINDEIREKMRRGRQGKRPNTRKVAQIDCKTGRVVRVFDCARDAAKEMGCHETTITEVARGKKNRKTAKGYKWSYDF